jgi:Potato inhibitor I family
VTEDEGRAPSGDEGHAPSGEEGHVPSEAEVLAPSLVGLAEVDAVRQVEDAGLQPQVVPPDATALTMEFRSNRIRIFVDETGRVTRARAG